MKHLLVLLAAAAVMPDLNQLKQMSARFAPVTPKYDTAALSAGDRKALPKLVEAARVLNHLFMDQLWSGNRDLYAKLQKDTTPLGKERLHYFWLNKGPWSDLDDHAAFVPGVPERKPLGANFYPPDMTREEFEAWVKTLPRGGARTGHRILHRHPARCEQETDPRPLQQGVRRRSPERRRASCAKPPRSPTTRRSRNS